MARHYHIPLLITFATILATCAWAQDGVLTNPTFLPDEGGETPANWSFLDYKTGGEALYEPDGGRDGSGALGIACATTEQRGAWRQRLQLEGMTHLYVSGFYRTEGLRQAGAATVRLTWLRGDRGWDFISDVRLSLQPSEEWAPFERVFTAPDEADAVTPELFNFFTVGTVWWDQLNIREATREELMEIAARNLDLSLIHI